MSQHTLEDWVIIGLSGVTNGGKTTLSNHLKNILYPVQVIHQDTYFYPEGSPQHVQVQGVEHTNYDILSSLDMNKLYEDVMNIINCKININDDNQSRDEKDHFSISNKRFLIIEGFTILNYKPIEEICNLKYYLHLPKAECYRRRIQRIYEPPDVPGYFDQCVWPEYLNYLKEVYENPSIVLISGENRNAINIIMDDLKNLK